MQQNPPGFLRDGCHGHPAFDVDHTFDNLLGRGNGQRHHAALGFDRTCLRQEEVPLGRRDRKGDQTVAPKVDRCRLRAAGQGNAPEARYDGTVVTQRGGDEGDQTALFHRDVALVDDGARPEVVQCQGVGPCHEGLDIEIARRGDQAADVDLRSGSEQDAVRVQQHDLAVGLQCAENLAEAAARDAVHRDRPARGLVEPHRGVAPDAEALPVDDHAIAGLIHPQRSGGRL